MKKINTLLLSAALVSALASCEMKEELIGGKGSSDEMGLLDLTVATSSSSNTVVTKAVTDVVDDFPVYIVAAPGDTTKRFASFAELKEQNPIELPFGTYTVVSNSPVPYERKMQYPYYKGEESVEISSVNQTTTVKCTIQNVKITFVPSAAFRNTYSDWTITVSDRLENVRGNVSVETMLLSGEKVSSFGKRIVAGANSSTKVLSLSVSEMTGGCKEGSVVIVLEFVPDKGGHDGLETEYANHFFLPKQKDMDYPDCHISIDVKEADGRYEVSATSGNFARGVYLYADGLDLHFSDNFFDLLPGETRTVTVETDIPAETLRARLRTLSLADTY